TMFVGALMALGMKFTEKQVLEEKKAEFERRFSERFGSVICREMLGYDIGKGELPVIMEKGLFGTVCCKAAKGACDILEDMLNA
ncbi:MAG: C_GCAxxG_C_C family protein, partial [Oscillospiraceae bacterium]|nr:C_GCAxxG_C_C family protein [Oscillospiraceae bacterium]